MKLINFIKKFACSWVRIRFISLTNDIHCARRVKLMKAAQLHTIDGGRVTVKNGVTIRENAEIFACGGDILLAGNNYINRNTMIVSKAQITIGEGTTIGPNTVIYDHDHDIKRGKGFVSAPIKIGKNVWIGAGAVILRGSVIEDNCVVPAGTVVRGIVPSGTMAYNRREFCFKSIEKD